MTTPKRNVRGLQDIRTISGSVDQRFVPHRAYMRITVLEMEKARREREKESAMHRVKNIEARFREIEAEKDALLDTLGDRRSGDAGAAPSQPESEPGSNKPGFKIRY